MFYLHLVWREENFYCFVLFTGWAGHQSEGRICTPALMANPHQISPVLFCDSLKGFFASGLTWITSWIILNYNKKLIGAHSWSPLLKWRVRVMRLWSVHSNDNLSLGCGSGGKNGKALLYITYFTLHKHCRQLLIKFTTYSESVVSLLWISSYTFLAAAYASFISDLKFVPAECVWRAAVRFSRIYSRI